MVKDVCEGCVWGLTERWMGLGKWDFSLWAGSVRALFICVDAIGSHDFEFTTSYHRQEHISGSFDSSWSWKNWHTWLNEWISDIWTLEITSYHRRKFISASFESYIIVPPLSHTSWWWTNHTSWWWTNRICSIDNVRISIQQLLWNPVSFLMVIHRILYIRCRKTKILFQCRETSWNFGRWT